VANFVCGPSERRFAEFRNLRCGVLHFQTSRSISPPTQNEAMDAIKDISTSLPEGIGPTYQVLLPYLIKNKETFHNQYSHVDSHKYGSLDRQNLDVYWPHSHSKDSPVLLFLYGGGFTSGAKRSPAHPDLIYANFGSFFADKGIIFVVADYRLAKGRGNPHGKAKYPSGGEDLAAAIKWIEKELGEKRKIFLMGHSAGAVHVMTFLFEPSLLKSVSANIAGAILVAPPAHQRSAGPDRNEVNIAYYGDLESVDKKSPQVLMETNGIVDVPLLAMVGTYDEEGIIKSYGDFVREYAKKGGKLDEIELVGHNHISPLVALNSTEENGTKWGYDVVEWIQKQLK
jgi:Carboxylesterase family